LQNSIVKVGEGGGRGEGSRFPQLPDVDPGHGQEHEEAHQVDPHLPAGWVPHHCNKHTKQALQETFWLHNRVYFIRDGAQDREFRVLFYLEISRSLEKLTITEHNPPQVLRS